MIFNLSHPENISVMLTSLETFIFSKLIDSQEIKSLNQKAEDSVSVSLSIITEVIEFLLSFHPQLSLLVEIRASILRIVACEVFSPEIYNIVSSSVVSIP